MSIRERVAVIEIDNPKKLNAWDMQMQAELTELIRSNDASADVDAMVVTGAGTASFCAGQDLEEIVDFKPADIRPWLAGLKELYRAPLSARKPVVAALRGVAVGSGYQFTLMCDARVSHASALIGQPEVKNGIPSITGYYLTERALGYTRAADLMLTGRLMDGAEAHGLGLVQRLVNDDDVLDTAVSMASDLAAQPKIAFLKTKQNILNDLWPGLEQAFEVARAVDEDAWGDGETADVVERFLA